MGRRRAWLLAVAGLAVAGATVLGLALATGDEDATDVAAPGRFRGSEPPGRIRLPDFSLRDHRGAPVRSRELGGKVVLVTFLESRCREACPVIASRLGRGLRLLDRGARGRVVALAISTHPADDTPASVRTFLRRQKAERELRYLVGSERELRPVWSAFKVLPALDTGDADIHSAPVRIFDTRGVWVSTLHAGADLTAENVRHDVLEALSGRQT